MKASVAQQVQSIVEFADEADALQAMDELRLLAEAFRTESPMDSAEVARRVERILVRMRGLDLKPNFPVNHFIADGMYARELLIPAGAFAIGEIQKERHISVIARGEITMLNDHGGYTRVRAPFTVINEPGVRKCGYAHEDTVWTTVHNISSIGPQPELMTLQALEDHLVARTPQEYALHRQNQLPSKESPCQLSQ